MGKAMEILVEHRLLPRADRDQFHYEVVRFHLEDLNAIAERRRAGRGRTRTAAPDLARVRAIVQAARWDPASFARAIRRFVDEGRGQGDDAFGPALLLMALEVADRGFLPTVRRPVYALATAMLGETRRPMPRPGKPAAPRARRAPSTGPAVATRARPRARARTKPRGPR
jgi:hypothetical protein